MHSFSALSAGSLLAYAAGVAAQFPSCPNSQLSCHNTTIQANTCCFNAPGGQLLQTQFWDASPSTGPSDSWTVHGLWPDDCSGGYQSNCDSKRAYTNITQILQSYKQTALLGFMNTYWVNQGGSNEEFWEHEWGKHGTCISTLEPSCYSDYTPQLEVVQFFNRTVELYKTLDTYKFLADAGITPSSSKTYSLSAVNAALSNARGGVSATLQCVSGAIDEVWYTFNVQGSVTDGTFVPATPVGSTSNCPSTVKYLPKSGSSQPTPSPKRRVRSFRG